MELSVNGQPQKVAAGTSVADLLEQLNLRPRMVAVERNHELIPRARHAECELQPDDQIEIVTLVGGG